MSHFTRMVDPLNRQFVHQQSSCAGKKRFAKRSHAERFMDERRSSGKGSETLVVYKCSLCGGGYHLGHLRQQDQ